jgi:hypothetical protein
MAKDLYTSSLIAPRYIGGIYQQAVKSSAEYVTAFLNDNANFEFNVTHCNISQQLDLTTTSPNASIIDLEHLGARDLRTIVNQFDPVIYDVFGGWNGAHPRINSELTKLGPLHGASTIGLASSTTIVGLAYRMRSYYTMSVTGVVNSLFFIINHSASLNDILSGIRTLAKHPFSFGTNDLVLVYDNSPQQQLDIEAVLRDVRRFGLYVIDNHLNRERLGIAGDDKDYRSARNIP